jgi:hypothetical protein
MKDLVLGGEASARKDGRWGALWSSSGGNQSLPMEISSLESQDHPLQRVLTSQVKLVERGFSSVGGYSKREEIF